MKWIFFSLLLVSILVYLILFSSWPHVVFDETNSNESTRRYAVFACSIHSTVLVYTFYAPILVASWRRVGYESIVFFVGDFSSRNATNSKLNLTRTYLNVFGAKIIDIQCPENYSIKVSQMIRIFAGFITDSLVNDNDTILTTDSDLMPLHSQYYQPAKGYDGFIYNSFCCGKFQRRNRTYRMYPMAHFCLSKKIWRQIVLESDQRKELLRKNSSNEYLNSTAKLSFDLVQLYGRHEFSTLFDENMVKGDSSWYMDQIFSSMLISDFRSKHRNFKLNERGRARRLDRSSGISSWNRQTFSHYGDAHLIHDEILLEANWKIFKKLLRSLFDESSVELFNDYYVQYRLSS